MKSFPSRRLMIPGPAEIDDDVVFAMGQQTAAHYGPDWVALFRETESLLKQAFVTEQADVLMPMCSGSAGVEAAVGSMFARGEKILIVSNGFFGERMSIIARSMGLEVVNVTAVWNEIIDPEIVRDALQNDTEIAGLLAIHHETSKGTLTPIPQLSGISKEFGLPFIVDAVASLAGDPLYFDEWELDMCITAGNKCLGAPVGYAPIAVSQRAWEFMDSKETAANWYLDLKTWRKYRQEWGDWHPTPVTMSTQVMLGLNVAVKQLLNEGLEARWARYKETAEWFRAAMKERGFEMFVEGDAASSVITVVHKLPDMEIPHFIDYLRDEHQIQIAGGLGETKDMVMRVGHMGNSRENIGAFLTAVDQYLQ